MNDKRDTIAAIATAHGTGAIGVVRVSGGDASSVLGRVFRVAGGCSVDEFLSHRMYYGKIFRGNEVVDEVMVCFMRSPRSFTCEDCVEIFAHGGLFVLGEVLSTVLDNGARLAEPGEFTKRAFLNGRLNLAQAEAVADLIGAKTAAAQRAALRQLGGGLSERIETNRDRILQWLAHIELSIDYPEHEEEARNAIEIIGEAGDVLTDLRKLCETADTGRIIRNGVRTAIIGRPNVGKSTLLNAILRENRAIVHETAGTTRDVLTEEVRVADVPLVIMDTAGLRETSDPIEKIGIEKTHEAVLDAELILYVADATEGLTEEDYVSIELFAKSKNFFVLLNKADLLGGVGDNSPVATGDFEPTGITPLHSYVPSIEGDFCSTPPLPISAKNGEGLDVLFSRVRELFLAGSVGEGGEADIITRERHRVLLEYAVGRIENSVAELSGGVPEDLVSVSLRAAYIALGEILGKEIGDDIVDRIFAEFCVGK